MNQWWVCVLCGHPYAAGINYGCCPECSPKPSEECKDAWAWRMIRKLATRITELENTLIQNGIER